MREAALELFHRYGYEAVTITQIAEHAGITRRSYFRYFPDKREVLFAGSDQLPPYIAETVLAAPEHTPPLAAALQALAAAGAHLATHATQPALRRAIIATTPELQERERSKAAAITTALTEALHRRGTAPGKAAAIAHLTGLAFATAWTHWIDADGAEPFPACLDAAITTLREALCTD
ncbi:transcriptional regulator [Actinoplanes sp. N902-109]|nr:transcriptional regulator [Actinoplanes sp. N902-109]